MFQELRLKKREIPADEARRLLESGNYGVLSVCGADGYGYGVPLNYVFFENKIYFHCASEGKKLDDIAQNDKVGFSVTGKSQNVPERLTTAYKSVVVFGRARRITGGEKNTALRMLMKKYAPDFMEKGLIHIEKDQGRTVVVGIEIEHLCGKANQ